MAQTPRPAEAVPAAARRVKDLARDLATDFADGYRRSTRYFRMRVAVVATWALLSIAALFASCPSSGPTNALRAVVRLLPGDESLVGAQVLVANESADNWTDVTFTLDGGWAFQRKTVRAGDKVVLSLRQFRKDEAAPPEDLRPKTLRIDCVQGSATEGLVQR
ncbi:MAG: hypothetical protein QM704_18400 [Anaeromyxobacteraceae bacterium]